MNKKRILAVAMAVVLFFTTAFSFAPDVLAQTASETDAQSEMTATSPDAEPEKKEKWDISAEDLIAVYAHGSQQTYNLGGIEIYCVNEENAAIGRTTAINGSNMYIYCGSHNDASPFSYDVDYIKNYYVFDTGLDQFTAGAEGRNIRCAFWDKFRGANPNNVLSNSVAQDFSINYLTPRARYANTYLPDSNNFRVCNKDGAILLSNREGSQKSTTIKVSKVGNVYRTEEFRIYTDTSAYSDCIQARIQFSGAKIYYKNRNASSFVEGNTAGGDMRVNDGETIYFEFAEGQVPQITFSSVQNGTNEAGYYIGRAYRFRPTSSITGNSGTRELQSMLCVTGTSVSLDMTLAATPESGSIKIHKYSASPELTDGNACYSLQGAVFGVFKTHADAENATEANENAAAIITTDASGNGSADNLPYGTYYVKETKASPGYRLNRTVYTAVIADDTPVSFDVPEEAGADPADVLVRKKDADETVYLEGCVFAIRYYDVQMTTDPAQAGYSVKRTWYIKTDADGYANLDAQYLQAGSDALHYDQLSGKPTIPLGTITVQEITAPEGYVLDDTIHTFKIEDNPSGLPHVDVENARTIPNSPMQQPFEFIKLAEGKKGTTYPLANAGFMACAVKDLTSVSADYVPAEGEVIVTDDSGCRYIWNPAKAVVLTADGGKELFTDENGYAKSIPLDYGKYIVRETTVPKNFHPVEAFTVNITENSDEPMRLGYLTDRSFRAYLKIIKKDDTSGKKILSDAATFKIWSYEDNDYVTFNVTGADGSVTSICELQTADGELLTPEALMPGRYRIDEVKTPDGYYKKSDAGYDITIDADAVYTVYETKDGNVTDMGVFTVEIENTRLDGLVHITKEGEKRIYNETKQEFETKMAKLSGITFRVYADEDILSPDGSGETLYAKDTLVDTVITDADGNAATKKLPLGTYRIEEETPAEYVPADPVTVVLAADGQKTKLLDENGNTVESILYELAVKNTLKDVKIHTTAKDRSGNKLLKAVGTVEIIDTVYYENLVVGKTYTLSGYPVYAESGNKLTDKNGNPVAAETSFTAKSASGSVDVVFTIDASALAGKSIVFFESLYRDGELIAIHADITDEGQTVLFAPDKPDVPKTGDAAKPVIPFVLLVCAAGGIIVMLRLKKKTK